MWLSCLNLFFPPVCACVLTAQPPPPFFHFERVSVRVYVCARARPFILYVARTAAATAAAARLRINPSDIFSFSLSVFPIHQCQPDAARVRARAWRRSSLLRAAGRRAPLSAERALAPNVNARRLWGVYISECVVYMFA